MIKGILAVADNGFIGCDNKIVWDYPEDMRYFRNKTEGHLVVMGSKTYESLGCKPLPNRRNLVLSHNKSFQGAETLRDIGKVIEIYHSQTKDLFVIGGSEVYLLFEPFIESWEITRVKKDYELLAAVHKATTRRFTPDLRDFVCTESYQIKALEFMTWNRKSLLNT